MHTSDRPSLICSILFHLLILSVCLKKPGAAILAMLILKIHISLTVIHQFIFETRVHTYMLQRDVRILLM